MTVKPRAKKKTRDIGGGDAGEKDHIAELKNRIAALENELRLKNEKTVRDTAKHRQTVEKLAENERFLRNIFECIQDGISVLDKDLNIVQVNPSMDKWYGEHIRGKKCYEAYHGRSEPCELCPSIRAIKEGSTQTGVVHDLKGWREIYAFPLVNDRGEVTGVIEHVRDIDEHKRAQEALRESEEKFRALAESAKAGIILTQGDKFIYVNPEVVKDLGYTKEELLTMNFWDVVHPDSRELVKSRALERLQGKPVPSIYEMKVLTKDGETLLEEVSSTLIDYMGKPTIIATLFNITERKRIEKALIKEKYILTKSQESARVGNWAWDLETGEMTGSAENSRIFGFEPDQIKTTFEWVISRVLPEDRVAVADFVEAVARDGKVGSIDYRIMRPDGSVRYVNSIADKVVRDKAGKIKRFYGISQDVTERKLVEESLRESEQKFRVLAETSPAAIFLYQGEKYVYVNPMAETLTGYSEVELLTGDAWEWVHPEFKAVVKGRAMKRQRGEQLPTQYEVKYRTKDGREGWVDFAAGLIDFEGKPAGLAMAFDVTKRMQAEKELKDAKLQAELYLDLMGHDINNMHQVALGYLELASSMPPSKEQVKFLDKPVEVLQRSAQLIRNVRKLQKLREGVFQTQVVDVCEVLMDVQREFGAVPNKAITLNTNKCEHCLVRANELLHDVFANLVSNAIKHTGDLTDIVIDMDVLNDKANKYCRVMIEDNGPGIPDDFKSVIFNRALRGTSKARGMGLGLYLVKSLVDSYGGRVWVEDRIQGDHTKGARFVVVLPSFDK